MLGGALGVIRFISNGVLRFNRFMVRNSRFTYRVKREKYKIKFREGKVRYSVIYYNGGHTIKDNSAEVGNSSDGEEDPKSHWWSRIRKTGDASSDDGGKPVDGSSGYVGTPGEQDKEGDIQEPVIIRDIQTDSTQDDSNVTGEPAPAVPPYVRSSRRRSKKGSD